MLMADEAISVATEEIESKFTELMKKENFNILDFYGRQKLRYEPSKNPIDLTTSFDMVLKPAISDTSLLAQNANKADGKKAVDSNDAEEEAAAAAASLNSGIDQNNIRQIVNGIYHTEYRAQWPTNLRGRTDLEFDVQTIMRYVCIFLVIQ